VKKKGKGQTAAAFALIGSVGITMAAAVGVGIYLGRLADNWLGTGPWFTIAGIVLGMASGIWSTYKRVMEVESEE